VNLTTRSLAFLIALLAVPTAALAQPLPSGTTPLFGGAKQRIAASGLDCSLSVVEAYDSETPSEYVGIVPPETLLSGYSTMFIGTADYRWRGRSVEIGAGGQSVFRHYLDLEDTAALSQSGAVGLSARLGARTTFLANQSVAYSPAYLYGLFPSTTATEPGAAIPTAPNYVVDDSESMSYDTTLTLTRGLSRRSRLSASGNYQFTDFMHETPFRPDLRSGGLHGALLLDVSRNTTTRIGYEFRTGTFESGADVIATQRAVSATENGIGVGLSHVRPLSKTRSLTFSADLGWSSVNVPDSPASADAGGRLNRVSGKVALDAQLTSGWRARAAWQRGLEYIADLTQPVFVDGVMGEVGGLVSRRIEVLAAARYSSGASALNRGADTFDTHSADLRIRYGLTQSLAIYGEYLYYFYDFRENRRLAPGIPPVLDRNGVRVGFTLWMQPIRR
jgi:hypothetical protein